MTIYTHDQYMAKLHNQASSGPTVEIGGKKFKAGIQGTITAVERQAIDGKPVLVLHLREGNGEEYGVIMNRRMADDLTSMLGPHPLVEEFFGLN